MAYQPLGPRELAASATEGGTNAGNFTAVFTPAVINVSVSVFEIYRACVETAKNGTAVKMRIGSKTFSVGPVGEGAEWDPSQPALVQGGQTVSFLFSQPATETPAPKVTIWLRYAA